MNVKEKGCSLPCRCINVNVKESIFHRKMSWRSHRDRTWTRRERKRMKEHRKKERKRKGKHPLGKRNMNVEWEKTEIDIASLMSSSLLTSSSDKGIANTQTHIVQTTVHPKHTWYSSLHHFYHFSHTYRLHHIVSLQHNTPKSFTHCTAMLVYSLFPKKTVIVNRIGRVRKTAMSKERWFTDISLTRRWKEKSLFLVTVNIVISIFVIISPTQPHLLSPSYCTVYIPFACYYRFAFRWKKEAKLNRQEGKEEESDGRSDQERRGNENPAWEMRRDEVRSFWQPSEPSQPSEHGVLCREISFLLILPSLTSLLSSFISWLMKRERSRKFVLRDQCCKEPKRRWRKELPH